MDRPRSSRLGVAAPWFVTAALIFAGAPAVAVAASSPPARPNKPVCPGPVSEAADCHARVVTDRAGKPLAGTGPSGYGPADFHTAYGLPNTSPTPQTIAIVDAYDDPTIESDLAVYSSTYGLPACTSANGCFKKVNQSGEEGPFPKTDPGWALEIALDVETAHAICQNCKILLVEASSNSFANLTAAVNMAASLGATEISNSYGGPEYSGEETDTSYDHPGIAITASAGDDGYAAEYPAASPYVIAVGGTTLTLGPSSSYVRETVWSGSGSGCSAYVPAPSWQTSDPKWAPTGCGTKRAIADVAAVADPDTGASVYDTTKYQGQSGWFTVGGTSLSAPLIAGVYALAGGASADYPATAPYAHQVDSPASLHDVTSGSNGSCSSSIMCNGAVGYDGPTGVGTPKGIAAFSGGGVDHAAPQTTIDSGPAGPTNDSTPSFAFSSSEPGSSFQCRIDDAAFATCTTPYTAASLGEGPHTFEVRAADAAANTDPSPAQRSFTVDTAAPSSQAASVAVTDSTSISIAYTASDAGSGLAGVELWVKPPGTPGFAKAASDSSPGPSGSFSYTAAAGLGTYDFYTRALDKTGNYEAAPLGPDSSTALEEGVQPDISPPDPIPSPAPAPPPAPSPGVTVPTLEPEILPSPAAVPGPTVFGFAGIDRSVQGRATLTVSVSGPGTLALFGSRVRTARRTVAAAGSVSLPIRPKQRFRSSAGRMKVNVRYTPIGGAPVTKTLWLRLD